MEREPRQHLITVNEYHRMAEVGLLAPDARVELIDGVIIDMAPIGSKHGRVVDWLNEALVVAARGKAIVRTQGAVELSCWSEPQPDIALLKMREDGYGERNPDGLEIHLVIEVCDHSLKFDYDTKSRLYARHGVPEVWIVDARRGVVHLFRSRTDLGYADIAEVSSPGVMQLPGLDVTVDLSKLFRK